MTTLPATAEPVRQPRGPSLEAPPPGRSFVERVPPMGGIRAVRRAVLVALWTLPCMAVQAVLLRLPGQAKARFARFYWRCTTALLGLRIRVVGTPARPAPGRPVVFAANHSSWLDIPVLGGTLAGRFVAKAEISRWPVISTVARLGRTVFVSRGRDTLESERDAMLALLGAGDNLILFPEGTSNDGARVMPFRSTFFSVADGARPGSNRPGNATNGSTVLPPVIQPVSVVYDQLAGLPAGRASRAVFAWYGDMNLASHYWQLAKWSGLRATVILHEPIDPAPTGGRPGLNRKQITQMAWAAVAEGAATLRQNRTPRPLGTDPRAQDA